MSDYSYSLTTFLQMTESIVPPVEYKQSDVTKVYKPKKIHLWVSLRAGKEIKGLSLKTWIQPWMEHSHPAAPAILKQKQSEKL